MITETAVATTAATPITLTQAVLSGYAWAHKERLHGDFIPADEITPDDLAVAAGDSLLAFLLSEVAGVGPDDVFSDAGASPSELLTEAIRRCETIQNEINTVMGALIMSQTRG